MANKRLFERLGAIFAIASAGICILMFIVILAIGRDQIYDILIRQVLETEEYAGLFTEADIQAVIDLMYGIAIFEIVVSTATIVVAALYMRQNKSRALSLGLGIPLCVLVGIGAAITFIFSLYPAPLGFVAAFVFLIISLTARDNGSVTVTTRVTYVGDPFSEGGGPAAFDPFDGRPMRGSKAVDPFDGSPVPGSQESLERKLADLKKLHEMGVITDEQYHEAVQNAVKQVIGDDSAAASASGSTGGSTGGSTSNSTSGSGSGSAYGSGSGSTYGSAGGSAPDITETHATEVPPSQDDKHKKE